MKEKKQPYLRGAERRDLIAEAARALMVENGLAALRTREVAARAGITVSTLHFHVATKSDLIALVAENSRDQFLALLPEAPDPDLPARTQLRAEARAYHDSLRDRPELAACFAQLQQLGGSEPHVAEMLDEFTSGRLRRYETILEFGCTRGEFRADLAPLPAALALTGALTSFAQRGEGGLALYWPVYGELERGFLAAPSFGGERR